MVDASTQYFPSRQEMEGTDTHTHNEHLMSFLQTLGSSQPVTVSVITSSSVVIILITVILLYTGGPMLLLVVLVVCDDSTHDVICQTPTVHVDVQSVAFSVAKFADTDSVTGASDSRCHELSLQKLDVSRQLLSVTQENALFGQQVQLLHTHNYCVSYLRSVLQFNFDLLIPPFDRYQVILLGDRGT